MGTEIPLFLKSCLEASALYPAPSLAVTPKRVAKTACILPEPG
jgi:hypothetical protein